MIGPTKHIGMYMDSKRASRIEAGRAKLEKFRSRKKASHVSEAGRDESANVVEGNPAQSAAHDEQMNLVGKVKSLSHIREIVCEETVRNSISIRNELKYLRESFKKTECSGEGYLEERVTIAMKIAQAVSEIYEAQSKACDEKDSSSYKEDSQSIKARIQDNVVDLCSQLICIDEKSKPCISAIMKNLSSDTFHVRCDINQIHQGHANTEGINDETENEIVCSKQLHTKHEDITRPHQAEDMAVNVLHNENSGNEPQHSFSRTSQTLNLEQEILSTKLIEIEHLKDELQKAKQTIEENNFKKTMLEDQETELRRQARDREAEAAELRARVVYLESELEAREQRGAAGAQTRLSKGLRELRELQRGELGKVEELCRAMEGSIEEAEREVREVQERYAEGMEAATARRAALEEEVLRTRESQAEEAGRLGRELAEAEAAASRAREALEGMQRELAEAQGQLAASEGERTRLASEQEARAEQEEELRRQARDREAEAAELRARVVYLESELEAREQRGAAGAQTRLSEGLRELRELQRGELGKVEELCRAMEGSIEEAEREVREVQERYAEGMKAGMVSFNVSGLDDEVTGEPGRGGRETREGAGGGTGPAGSIRGRADKAGQRAGGSGRAGGGAATAGEGQRGRSSGAEGAGRVSGVRA
ncbi:hypothetical protein GUITHDRAFT_110890 [Guillardia theta CCMP2712]|uniref:Uncharacterized protein n=1 Tax=Guillardia theta (strain CCMP2712) TaxID=905079 RepID=L1J3R1_GUITC|nr:hypothetical protein GUITHDRAFT_110890 [Guillardia theta CCMP2712]EKX43163.1 hypothetical protein GUITHDRAFT_110890 [Guillardia theta CCMP2712]|eukprot:XP_005830143.1 hypothetical protein GUITHDRAFT_110890 [Guillardia theta CCMP2712]